MNKYTEYRFGLIAQSPVSFGSSKAGEILKNSLGEVMIFGCSIGGAIRVYLEEVGYEKKEIDYFLGGIEGENFKESKIYISDGKLIYSTDNDISIRENERTKINYEYGVAEEGGKYSQEYLLEGIKLQFYIKCDFEEKEVEEGVPEKLKKIILDIANGFMTGELRLGGQKTNGFGEFIIDKLEEYTVDFNTPESLDEHIFDKKSNGNSIWDRNGKCNNKNKITISMDGYFFYGVYQNYRVNKQGVITGIKDDYIFGSSIKGIFRNEIELLIRKFIGNNEDKIKRKSNEIFGGVNNIGKIIFKGLKIIDAEVVKIKRYNKEDSAEGNPVYIKIDRITGGAINENLKMQREVQGKGTLEVILSDIDDNPYVFPLFYVFKRIGLGEIPLGGRTTIGLGEFNGELIMLGESKININEEMSKCNSELLRKYYDLFEGWCKND